MPLDALLARFAALPSAGPELTVRLGAGAPTTAIGCLVHGDEVGALPGVLRVLEGIAGGDPLRGTVLAFVGNPPAARAGQRFLEADLNRVFVPDGGDTAEHRRARALMPLLDEADRFLDLHQTILPGAPFWIGAWDRRVEPWIRALSGGGAGADRWVTRRPGERFAAGTCCADEYVLRGGRVAMTLELGQRGFDPDAAARAERTVRRLLALGPTPHEGPLPACLETVHQEAFTDPAMALRPGLVNFQPVRAGEALSADGTPPLTAPRDGLLLFPKYPPRRDGLALAPRPTDLYHLVAPRADPPAVAWG